MKKTVMALVMMITVAQAQDRDSLLIRKIFTEVLNNGKCYDVLGKLCSDYQARLTGSASAAGAVAYTKKTMEEFGFDRVWLQEVTVPHWVRGEKEVAVIRTSSGKIPVRVCALGNSVGTGKSGLRASVIEVNGVKDLALLGKERITSKIVFFNRPMNPSFIHTGHAYGDAVDQRALGAAEAARYGAVGVVVRSMTLANDDHPHTGMLRYYDTVPKIPACALSIKGANELSRLLKQEKEGSVEFYFRQTCEMLPDVVSHNVIGEIRGSEKPEEIIVVGGHLDSWDLGQGAHDDGAGCVQSIEVLRLIKVLGIRPKRTIRCVMFMNEENGLKGALKYAEVSSGNNEKHIAAIESDGGGFTPRAFGVDGDTAAVLKMQPWVSLLKPYGISEIRLGWGGADISPLKKQKTTLIGYVCDSQRYFDIHHTEEDTFDKVNRRELELGAGSMAALVYLLSEYGL